VIRSFHHTDFPLDLLLERKREPISAVLPAREVADTVGPIVERLLSLNGLLDQVLVVDAASADGTAVVAANAGAEIVEESEFAPECGAVLGKGDAMWRALDAVTGALVVFLDADTREFSPHFATGLLGPLLADDDVSFVKARFDRPLAVGTAEASDAGGGRVTELIARPLLCAFYPELAGFAQPLAGEVAARRELFERIPFSTGYAVETAMLLDVRDAVGLEAMAQVDLGERHNSHQSLSALAPMAYAVLSVIVERLRGEGRMPEGGLSPLITAGGDIIEVDVLERPPHALRAER